MFNLTYNRHTQSHWLGCNHPECIFAVELPQANMTDDTLRHLCPERELTAGTVPSTRPRAVATRT